MDDVVMASSEADARAVTAVQEHHAALAGALAVKVERLVTAAARGHRERAADARRELAAWCEHELVPHALAEEKAMYPAAQGRVEGRLLVEGMLAEHRALVALVEELGHEGDPVRAAGAARALQELFEAHLAKENELVLPLLAADPVVSVAALLAGMHELLGEDVAQEAGCDGHTCACGEREETGLPELDARSVPHAIRHATIFGALDAVAPGSGLVLVAPHDPVPLLGQLELRAPGAFEVEYLQRGPEAWRLQLVRRG
jgi:uncharacterized protein (DUF2249 family)